jgi:hypothetical protein
MTTDVFLVRTFQHCKNIYCYWLRILVKKTPYLSSVIACKFCHRQMFYNHCDTDSITSNYISTYNCSAKVLYRSFRSDLLRGSADEQNQSIWRWGNINSRQVSNKSKYKVGKRNAYLELLNPQKGTEEDYISSKNNEINLYFLFVWNIQILKMGWKMLYWIKTRMKMV